MNRFYTIPKTSKIEILQNVGEQNNLPAYAVEKDWWVVQTLAIIFEMEIGKQLVFKGGTSLSKAWNLIDRFSEDIDLAVNRSFFGFQGALSKKERTKLRKATSIYIADIFFPELIARFKAKGLLEVKFKIVEAQSSDQDPRIIDIYYPNVIKSPGYIQPKVQIEIGCRSLREPLTIKPLTSFVDLNYPNTKFAQTAIKIPTVNPERTFLEKIFLLHEEFQRPEEKIRVNRLSRHLYDIYQLSKTKFAEKGISDKTLYQTIVKHRHTFTKLGGVNYNLHNPNTVNPIPPPQFLKAWEKDYKTMQEQMIYGQSPSFDEMISKIKTFTKKLNQINWQFDCHF